MSVAGLQLRPAPWRWVSDLVWRIEHAYERAKAAGRPEDDVRIRMVFILAIFAAGFLTLAFGATRAALAPAGARGGWTAPLPHGSRADLTDRHGAILAIDLPVYSLYLDPGLIWDREETRRVLGPLVPEADRGRIERALSGGSRVKISGPFDKEVRQRIDGFGLPGVSFEAEAGRSYPLGATAAHFIGYAGVGGVGLSGAELALDSQLKSAAGQGPVALSLDLRVQAALEDELERIMTDSLAQGAVGIVTNVHTGEILGLASLPDAAPDRMSGTRAETNHAWQSVYEMGSTFKIFTTALALDSGLAGMNDTFDVSTPLELPGRDINDYHGANRTLTLGEVFTHSSNIGTGKLALQVGGPTMTRYFEQFGLFSAAPIELPGSARPLLPARPERWDQRMIATTSFGHAISVSPLTMAASVGAIMNGGSYVPLTIQPRTDPPAALRQVVSPQTSRLLLQLMRANAVEGTGRRADAAATGYRVGGKTGTADKVREGGGYGGAGVVASFASVFPADGALSDPRYLVLILVDHPRSTEASPGTPGGGTVAAPVAGRVINRIAPFLGVQRREDSPLSFAARTSDEAMVAQ